MAKEIVYRRSFHSDRDFRGMLHSFEFDQALTGKRPISNGLEAPRNSLDIPSELVADVRKKTHAAYSDIPYGYELTRSLTSKRTTEEIDLRGFKLPANARESEQKCKTPSLVARLMGLDAMPDDAVAGYKKSGAKQTLSSPSKRHELSEDGKALPEDMHFQGYYADSDDERSHLHALSFQEHPQEKQLQEFKKHFAAHHGLYSKNYQTTENNRQGQLQSRSVTPEKVNEAKEFLDALEFLQSNKDFFLRVLHDPSSLVARNVQYFIPFARNEKPTHLRPNKTSMHSLELGKQGTYFSHPETGFNGSINEVSPHEGGLRTRKTMLPSNWRSSRKSRFQPNEDMPTRCHQYRRKGSLSGNALANTPTNVKMPARIVILKPDTRFHQKPKPNALSVYSPLATVDYKFLKDENKELDKAMDQDAKPIMKSCYTDSKRESQIEKEITKFQLKVGQKDPREIAREIVKQVKDDFDRKSKDVSTPSINRPITPQRQVVNIATGGMSNGEGSSTTSRRSRSQSMKLHSSLPNSPWHGKSLELSSSPNEFNLVRKKDFLDESKQVSGRLRNAPRNPRWGPKSFLHTHASSAKCPTLDNNASNKSIMESEPKSNSPRVLPRSRSVPNKENFRESDHTAARHKLADTSLLVDKISSLKHGLSLAKKKNRRNAGTSADNSLHASSSSLSSSSAAAATAATETTISRCLFPAEQHCEKTEDSAWTSFSVPEVDSSTEFSEQYSDTNCISTPEHILEKRELSGRLCTGQRADSNLIFPEWGSAADAIDSGSETSVEKPEQPSPVSVLSAPFQEESPSPMDIQECKPNFDVLNEELQLKLHRLRLDGTKLESRSNEIDAVEMNSQSGSSCTEESCKSSMCFSAHDIQCFNGREADLTYIRDILLLSGLAREDRTLVKSFSVDHGLDPSIFSKVEHHYRKQNSLDTLSIRGGTKILPNAIERRLVFDVVDEIILTKLGMPADHQPWVRCDQQIFRFMWTGRQLIERVWAEVKKYFSLDHESQDDTLEDLAAKALSEGGSWLTYQLHKERVCLEVEQRILKSLVEEVVCELLNL